MLCLVLAAFVAMLLCVPELKQLDKFDSVKKENFTSSKQENEVVNESRLDPVLELQEIKDLQKSLKESTLSKAKAVNAKAYFQLRKLETLSEAELRELASMTPEERKSLAKSRVVDALIAHLQK